LRRQSRPPSGRVARACAHANPGKEAGMFARFFAWFSPPKLPHPPVFVIGCGRSGTTIFGTALSQHSRVTYLNERRDLWFAAYPESDIWTDQAAARQGKMVLTAADAHEGKSAKLLKLFAREVARTRRPVLVEKLPINNFRLPFLRAVFPDAKFIHLHRNGLEVARSIEKLSESGEWFGNHPYKWDQLVQVARSKPETAALPGMCTDYFDQGLLEWRLSTEAAVAFLRVLPRESYHELSYASLIHDPITTIHQVLSFIGISPEPAVETFVQEKIARRTDRLDTKRLSEKEKQIGGALLPLSMAADPTTGLTSWARAA
jgi:hypothetical protein